MKFDKSIELRKKMHRLIPGGAHTYAKGDDQFPENAPAVIVRGEGCRVQDVDGNEFIEYGMGLRAVTLGHAYPRVIQAAAKQMQSGANFTRPSILELECAEEFLGCVPTAEMVKFCKDGSDATSGAVRLARAYTGRDLVAVCAEHPFFSVDDWFIGTMEMNSGIPEPTQALTVKFHYNDAEGLDRIFHKLRNRIAGVILEAATWMEPENNFLADAQNICKENNAIFILDEMITGFRWDNGGAQKVYGITPDLSTFGKAMANGFALSALAGKKEIMELGGIQHDRERVFLLSTTHGAETHALAAGIETMKTYREEKIVESLYRQGTRLSNGINRIISDLELEDYFRIAGRPCNLIYMTRDSKLELSQEFRTLFMQEMIRRGFLAPSFVVSVSHTDDVIDHTIDCVEECLRVYKRALNEGVEKYLNGRPVKPVNRRFN
jgi:glutamate-1-semialdehyde 2,1-aminomutase